MPPLVRQSLPSVPDMAIRSLTVLSREGLPQSDDLKREIPQIANSSPRKLPDLQGLRLSSPQLYDPLFDPDPQAAERSLATGEAG